jgi:hypothetical protein
MWKPHLRQSSHRIPNSQNNGYFRPTARFNASANAPPANLRIFEGVESPLADRTTRRTTQEPVYFQ